MKKLISKVVIIFLFSVTAQAHKEPINETIKGSVMKHLLGKWQISDQYLDAEGKWQQGAGASWNWYPILNGNAIQDDWVGPSLDKAAPNGRQYGTNIRIYNPVQKQWEMAWASSGGQKVDVFTAQEKNGQIIMNGLFNGKNSKITFYNINKQSFDWRLEYEKEEKGQWREVYRIKALREE